MRVQEISGKDVPCCLIKRGSEGNSGFEGAGRMRGGGAGGSRGSRGV